MKEREERYRIILDAVRDGSARCQNDFIEILKKHGIEVAQATLSRDLKKLRIRKIGNSSSPFRYQITQGGAAALTAGSTNYTPDEVKEIKPEILFSGNLMVLKTRNGYAPGLAFEIDRFRADEFLGSVAGTDTVIVVLKEGVTHERAKAVIAETF